MGKESQLLAEQQCGRSAFVCLVVVAICLTLNVEACRTMVADSLMSIVRNFDATSSLLPIQPWRARRHAL